MFYINNFTQRVHTKTHKHPQTHTNTRRNTHTHTHTHTLMDWGLDTAGPRTQGYGTHPCVYIIFKMKIRNIDICTDWKDTTIIMEETSEREKQTDIEP